MSVIDELTSELARLPGIGRKTAMRLTYHLLRQPPAQSRRLAESLVSLIERVRACERCHNFTELPLCALCADPRRDATTLCVVEEAADIASVERAGEFRGLYHVLGGRLSPLDGVGPDDLAIGALLARIEPEGVREVILATNPNTEGEATANYLNRLLKPLGVKVTRIGMGLPVGSDLEYADEVTMHKALVNRHEM